MTTLSGTADAHGNQYHGFKSRGDTGNAVSCRYSYSYSQCAHRIMRRGLIESWETGEKICFTAATSLHARTQAHVGTHMSLFSLFFMQRRSIPCRASEMYGGFYGRPDMSNFHGNKPRPELRPILRKWVGRVDLNRSRASPHIKTYCRYREVDGENGER